MRNGIRSEEVCTDLHRLVQVLHPKPVQKRADDMGMTKHTARLMPAAVVVTGLLAAFGGYFSGR